MRALQAIDLEQIGEFMDEQLTKRNVWCMLMPSSIFNDPDKPVHIIHSRRSKFILHGVLVFVNDKQKLLVDINTEQGSKLYDGILESDNGPIYPDEYHQNLIVLTNYCCTIWAWPER